MRTRPVLAIAAAIAIATTAFASGAVLEGNRASLRDEGSLPRGFRPAILAQQQLNRYFVIMSSDSVADRVRTAGELTGAQQRALAADAERSQSAAIRQAEAAGATVLFRYRVLVNGFSAVMSPEAAAAMAARSDVASVERVGVVRRLNETSVPFIGAPQVWQQLHARGEGMRVAVVDTGIDYTHANFGGPGTVAAYETNNPNFVEPGTFPTAKVIGGYDFVGDNYDVLDDDPTNDTPNPDLDPLDADGHGSHTAGTCCGNGVSGQIGKGVAPKSKLLAVRVWDEGNSTDDVLVAGYEFAVDPNQNGDTGDAVDVLSFSGGVDYGTLNSVEARAAQRVVDIGTVFVASAGNSGNQPSGASAYITGTPANARGVVSVAASIDEFLATTLVVNSPTGVTLPDNGIMVVQPWGAPLPPGGLTTDIFDGREVDPATTDPSDAMFCDPLPPGSLTGEVPLVYKGSTGAGDCDGSLKAFNAQNAGADGVIFVSLFGGLPFALGPGAFGDQITIPVVMISGADGAVLFDTMSPNAPTTYNEVTVNVTLEDVPSPVPGFDDAMTDFTSEGPARLTSDLKPDISAPGFNITSTAVGTGDEGTELSGTSMAAPHVSGVATLLRQLHPTWGPGRIKAVLMNQATRAMKNNDLTAPVPATVMGSGRVQAFQSARAVSLATPGSLSYGLQHLVDTGSSVQPISVINTDDQTHHYTVSGGDRYSDFDPAMTSIEVSLDNASFGASRSFNLQPHAKRKVYVELTVDPSFISEAEQLYGWYYFHPNMDGTVTVHQSLNGADNLRVAWHVAPLAATDNGLSESALDLTGGPQTMTLTGDGAGVDYGDLYLLGAVDEVESQYEEDIAAIGARSFTGDVIGDDQAEGVPTGTDELVGLTWQEFIWNGDFPDEPVEIGVQSAFVHNTTETLEVDVLVDTGADGVFAGTDDGVDADYMIVKLPEPGGTVCVFDLSQPDPFDECTATYFPDYTNYNGNVVGLVVDAEDIGLSNGVDTFSYQVTQCTGTFSGDVPGQICDTAGEFDEGTGTYEPALDARDPALEIDPLVCRGFWDGGACDAGDPITVQTGSAGPTDDPAILALFPNNVPSEDPTVVTTDT